MTRRITARGIGRWLVIGAAVVVLVTALPVLALRWFEPPTTAFILRHNLNHPEQPAQWRWINGTEMASVLPLAVIASEDQRFPRHMGIDFQAIDKALQEHRRGGDLRGASTISQQVAKNLFLWPAQSYVRKAIEAWFTVWIELLWPKQRILEMYLNIAQFGPHTFGVAEATQRFFGKPPARVHAAEAARLAAVLPNPRRFSAANPSGYIYRRQLWIQRQMWGLGGVSYLDGVWRR